MSSAPAPPWRSPPSPTSRRGPTPSPSTPPASHPTTPAPPRSTPPANAWPPTPSPAWPASPSSPDVYARRVHRIFTTSVASVYPHYVAKVERKGRTRDELDEVIRWLTGFDQPTLERHLADETTFLDFFD